MTVTPAGAAARIPAAARTRPVVAAKRLFYVDNLRVGLIMLVIAHHVAQPYGPTGGAWPFFEAARSPLLGPFFTVNRSFFMSLFFMISGYFVARSFDSSGARGFVMSRLRRLGVPLLWWILLMIPLQVLLFRGKAWPVDVGHMWFIEHLLVFSLAYALWRYLTRNRAAARPVPLAPPGVLPVLGFALAIAVVSGIVREFYDIDRWVFLGGFLKVMWADVPRDLAFFIVGLIAYRNDWFSRFPTRAGMGWLAVGLASALFWYAYELGFTGTLVPTSGLAAGLLRLLWEGLFCCSIIIGLTVLFRERLNFGGRVAVAMGEAQYATYIFHLFVVLLVQYPLLSLPLPPLAKFALATPAAIALSFLVGSWVRKPLRL